MSETQMGTVRAELHHRPEVPGNGITSRVEDIRESLEDGGAVDEVDVSVWSRETPASPGTRAFETYRRFADWADQNGVSVEPAFKKRRRDSELLGESGEVVVTPCVALAVYLDDTLLAVYPHTDADGDTDDREVVTVEDGLAEIDVERRVVIREDEIGEQVLPV